MALRGFTLSELLVSIAIVAVALTMAVPAFQNLLAAQRSTAIVNQLIGAVTLARTEAIVRRRTVTFCPGAAGRCLDRNEWHAGALVFIDHDGNGMRDDGDTLVAAFPPLRSGERIYWQSFRNRRFLQFHPRGYTQWQNGSFLYCPADQRATLARLVIVNAAGRTRPGVDADGDGIVERAGGGNVRCPP